MRLLYKPFGIIAGIIAARLGRKAFDSVWTKIDETPPETVSFEPQNPAPKRCAPA